MILCVTSHFVALLTNYFRFDLVGLYFALFTDQEAFAFSIGQNPSRSRQAENSKEYRESSGTSPMKSKKNSLFLWGGSGYGIGYGRSLGGKVQVGGELSVQTNSFLGCGHFGNFFTADTSLEYIYKLDCDVTAISTLVNTTWYSDAVDGLLLSAGIGLTQLNSSLLGMRDARVPGSLTSKSFSISDSVSSMGISVGFKLGYVYLFREGLMIGLLGNFVGTTAKLDGFRVPSEKAPEDVYVFDSMDQIKSKASASNFGALLGFTF